MSLFARALGAHALILTCVAALAPIGLAGCGTDEAEPTNNARLVVIHQARVLGGIDLLANGEKIAALSQGESSEALAVQAGTTVLEVRNTGADVTVLDTSLELRVQPYLVVVLGETLDALRFWTVDEPAPEPVDGEAAVRVVNLDSGEFTYDIYLGDDQIAAGVQPATASDYMQVGLGADAMDGRRTDRLRVFNAGDDPSGRSLAVTPAEVVLRDGRAYMFVLKSDAENPDGLSVTTISP